MAMDNNKVTQIALSVVPGADIKLEGEDCSFTICVISETFNGVRPLARQQKILAGFTEHIKNGDIHALSVKAFTPKEWEDTQALTRISIS